MNFPQDDGNKEIKPINLRLWVVSIILSPVAAARAALRSWWQRSLRQQLAIVRSSGLFSAESYLEDNPDVRASGADPVEHYLRIGWREGRRPGSAFDPVAYFAANPELNPATINPLLHYLQHGREEGRQLSVQPAPRPFPAAEAIKNGTLVESPVEGSRSIRLAKGVFACKLAAILEQCQDQVLLEALAASDDLAKRSLLNAPSADACPLVSVIMPTWNRAEIIADAIRSVVEQSYLSWELLVCDDGSEDNTEAVVTSFLDERIRYVPLPKRGGAAARNAGLAIARGEIIAYLDSDNFWHPDFIALMVAALDKHPGRSTVYADFIDYHEDARGQFSIRSVRRPSFNHERLLERNFIDLNSFVHRRELYDLFGGFNEALTRRQDYDLIIKYTWLRDPVHVRCLLALYQRNDKLQQVTQAMREDDSCVPIIAQAVESYLAEGLPIMRSSHIRRVTILSWDLSRNHFSKPFALAEALSRDYQVQLVAFRFFEEIFPPLKDVIPSFETVYVDGCDFPDFFGAMRRALDSIDGDVLYVVKPRLPSLGLALLANALRGTPVLLEINDLETVVASPTSSDQHVELGFAEVDPTTKDLLNPYSDLWSQLLSPLAKQLPVLLTHNKNIDGHYANRSLYMRNIKDDSVFDPALYDRDAIRAELGFSPSDRVILFGGLLRKHKGIFELVELVERLGDASYKLLFVGSRITPDQTKLIDKHGDRVNVLPPQDRKAMARINLAADLVILWLDPDVPASHYQMPYKLTDAFAMGPAVIANDVSDLGEFGRQGYLRIVPFGDWDAMAKAVRDVFDNSEKTSEMRAAARRLFLRQFSYPAARTSFALAAERALSGAPGPLPVAIEFEHWLSFFVSQTGES